MIADNRKGKIDTLYFIDSAKLLNANKVIEASVSENGFYGYKIIIKKDNYISLYYYTNLGQDASDIITIKWNQVKKKFELLKEP